MCMYIYIYIYIYTHINNIGRSSCCDSNRRSIISARAGAVALDEPARHHGLGDDARPTLSGASLFQMQIPVFRSKQTIHI